MAYIVLLLLHELGHAAAAKWRKVEVQSIRLLLVHANAGTYDKSFDALEQEWRLALQHDA